MKTYVDKAALQEFTTKLTAKNKTIFSAKSLHNKPLVVVSSYRDAVRDSVRDYYFAISYDGKSWYEIKDSLDFASKGIGSDTQMFEYGDGVIFLATSYDSSIPQDFYAIYTDDFVNYQTLRLDLGFLTLSNSLMGSTDGYVWTPMLTNIDGVYYITASIGIAATSGYDIYNYKDQKYLSVYAVPVNISVDNGFSITAAGSLFEIDFANTSASHMDCHIIEYDGYVYAIYKDRVYEIVNIARSDTINGEFVDIINFCGDGPYKEAGYFLKQDETLYAYFTDYYTYPTAHRAVVDLVNTRLKDVEFVGVVNSNHVFSNGLDVGMRNPCPMVMSDTLFDKFVSAYDIPTKVDEYKIKEIEAFVSDANIPYFTKVLYDAFGYYTSYNEHYYIINVNSNATDMYFSNPEILIRVNVDGTYIIHSPYGNVTLTCSGKTYKAFIKKATVYLEPRAAGIDIYKFDISNNSSKTVTFEAGTRGMVLTLGNATAGQGMYVFRVHGSSGAVAYSSVLAGSGISLTTGTNSLTISNSSGGAISCVLQMYDGGVSSAS